MRMELMSEWKIIVLLGALMPLNEAFENRGLNYTQDSHFESFYRTQTLCKLNYTAYAYSVTLRRPTCLYVLQLTILSDQIL